MCVRRIFGGTPPPVSGTKPFTAHPLGATAAMETAICALALRDQWLPPTLHHRTPDPACEIDIVPNTGRDQGAALKDLAKFNGEIGVQGGWQNHSGADYVGAPIWDVWTMIRNLDPKHIGMCFDIGHSTLEGGLSWPVQARLMEPFYVAVYLKDFYWEKTAKGWQPLWCPFGEGSVQRSFLTNLKTTNFAGPLSQHHEYKTLGTGKEMIANMKKDLAKLREWIA
jgi:sugar phosphate isomerase/epimerase